MSYSKSNIYETVYVSRPNLSESDITAIQQKVEQVIGRFQGKVNHKDDWGVCEMAYTIDKERSGRYHVVHYTGKSGVVEEIERHFRISDGVIRYLTVSVSESYDYTKVRKQMHNAAAEEESQRDMKEMRGRKGL